MNYFYFFGRLGIILIGLGVACVLIAGFWVKP